MAYNSIEKKRLEEYKKILSMAEKKQSSINMPSATDIPGATNFLPTRSGQMEKQIKLSQNEEKNNTWLKKSSAMEDENKLRGIAKTIASTGYDISGNFLKGVGSIIEGTSDTIKYGYAGIQKALGNAEKAQRIKNEASQVNNFENFLGYNKNVDKDSILGDKSDNIVQGLGYIGGIIAAGKLGAAAGLGTTGTTALTTGVTGTSAMGSGMTEAYQNGATDGEALTYGLISGIAEAGTELIFGGLGKSLNAVGISKGLSSADDMLAKKISSKFKSQLAKNLTEYTVKSLAEGSEEVMAGVIQAIGKKITYMSKEDLSKIMKDEKLLDQFISGAIISGISQAPSLVKSNIKGQDFIQKETVEQNKILPTVNDLVNQEQTSNVNYNQVNLPVVNDLTKNNINNNKNQIDLNIKKYTDNDINRFLTGNNLIDGINAELNLFVKKYYDPVTKKAKKNNIPTKTQKMFLGRINDNLAEKLNTLLNNSKMIQEKLGIKYDTKDANIVISSNNIEHSYNHHGNEKRSGQIDVTPENLSKYGEVVSNPDYIGLSSQLSRGKTPTFYFTKKINGYSVAVEVLSTKKQLYPESYYVFKSDSKEYLEFIKNNKLKKAEDVVSNDIMSDDINALGDTSVAFSTNNIPQSDNNVKSGTLPITNNMQNNDNNTINMPVVENKKVMNPLEISKMTKEAANTTPILPTIKVSTGDGESKFTSNIRNKTDMLSESSKNAILSNDDVNFYEKVTNKESLEKAFERLNKNGKIEILNWINKKSENATDVDVAEGWILLKQYQDKIANTDSLIEKDNATKEMVQVAKKLREMGTKAGQTVQAFNILNRLTPEGMVYYAQSELSEAFEVMSKNKTKEWIDSNRDKFELTPEETQLIMDTMQEVQQMEDGYDKRVKLAEIQKLMTDKLPPERGAGIKSWMRISMLFNPKTQVRNVAGNAIIAPVNSFSDLFASVVDKQIAKKTGIRTTGNTSLKSYAKGFKTGIYQSYNDFKKGINTRNMQGNRFEVTQGKSFNDNSSIGKQLNRVDSFLSFLLDAGDRGFYEASFTNSINNQMILNNTDVVTQEMIDIATSEALSRTWQDNNNYTKFVLNVRNMLNNVNVKGYGLGDVLIPFAKTPANLTKAIVDYSPAGLIKTVVEGNNLRKALTNGQYTAQIQHQFVQDLGKATAGTMLYVIGYALAKAGVVSGESDEDKDVANFMKNTLGINSYSIKIGNKSFTYDWAQPIAAPLSIMANYVDKTKQNPNASKLENLVSSLDVAGNIILEQSFMESINTVLSNNEGIATGIQEAILDLPARAVPTLMKQITDLVDPVQRTSFEYDKPLESAVNSIKAKIPFLSQTLAPSVDTMGREIQKYGGKNNIFNVFLNPANVTTENISESAKEIYRLYKETGETNIMPRVAPYYINKNGKKITLDSTQRTKYQKISGEIIEDNVQKLLNTSEYKNMSDKEKAKVINDIVNYSYNIAQKEVLGTELSDIYKNAEQYSRIGDISDYYTFKNSIDDTSAETKKASIANYLINSNLKDNQIAVLYGKYYSDETLLNCLYTNNIPIKEFIKFNSQEFTTDYYDNGKAITNSRKNKVIKYVNSLNLSIPQKAILIKMEYSSYDKYDKQIVNYVNSKNIDFLDKAYILKKTGFAYFNKQIINYVNNMNISKEEKTNILKELGFTIRDGKVYY